MNNTAIFGYTWCHYTVEAVRRLPNASVYYFDREKDGPEMHEHLKSLTNQQSVPYVYINGKFIGGCSDI